jgi:hypothetical protein
MNNDKVNRHATKLAMLETKVETINEKINWVFVLMLAYLVENFLNILG